MTRIFVGSDIIRKLGLYYYEENIINRRNR